MRRSVVWLAVTVAAASSILAFAVPAAQVIQGLEVEQFLKKAKFIAKAPLGSGVTDSLKVTLELNGKTQFAVLKTVDQKRPGAQRNAKGEIEIDFQDSWRTEVAAYEFDKLLGLGMVPATIERMSPYENMPASLQLWVEASMSEAKRREKAIIPSNPEKWSAQLQAMAIFDALIYNTDRHPDNLLITDTFDIRLIDHSRSFRPNAELRNKEDLTRLSRSLFTKIEQLNKSVMEKKLLDYLTRTQVDGLLKRRQLLLDHVHELARKFGEQSVFYP